MRFERKWHKLRYELTPYFLLLCWSMNLYIYLRAMVRSYKKDKDVPFLGISGWSSRLMTRQYGWYSGWVSGGWLGHTDTRVVYSCVHRGCHSIFVSYVYILYWYLHMDQKSHLHIFHLHLKFSGLAVLTHGSFRSFGYRNMSFIKISAKIWKRR